MAIISSVEDCSYATIFCIPEGGDSNSPCICTKSNNVWGTWRKIFVNNNFDYYVEDLLSEANNGMSSPKIVHCGSNTLNTPYKDNLTNCSVGTAYISSSNDNGAVILFMADASSKLFIRKKYEGVWDDWEIIFGDKTINAGTITNTITNDYFSINNLTYVEYGPILLTRFDIKCLKASGSTKIKIARYNAGGGKVSYAPLVPSTPNSTPLEARVEGNGEIMLRGGAAGVSYCGSVVNISNCAFVLRNN